LAEIEYNRRTFVEIPLLMFGDFVASIYPIEVEIKDITDTGKSASYLDLHSKLTERASYLMRIQH
jgi:hypothetical protein